MSLILTAPPAAEPLSLAQANAHLRVDSSAEDAFISSLIITSRLHIEAALGLALISQSWAWTLDAWPERREVALPMRPVRSIESITVQGVDGAPTVLSAASYVLDGNASPARIVPLGAGFPASGRPALGIEIRFTAGFGSAPEDVPQPIRQALLMLVAHWFENREPVLVGDNRAGAMRIPDTVSELLAPYRTARL